MKTLILLDDLLPVVDGILAVIGIVACIIILVNK